MPDIVVRHIDNAMAERIKTLARERQWPVNDVILHALRYGLGMGADVVGAHEHALRSVADVGGSWGEDETAAFQDAVDALAAADTDEMKRKSRAPGAGSVTRPSDRSR